MAKRVERESASVDRNVLDDFDNIDMANVCDQP